jgi:Holliday junction resolvase-like predicted endonuclease
VKTLLPFGFEEKGYTILSTKLAPQNLEVDIVLLLKLAYFDFIEVKAVLHF